eukprot:3163210-Prymnesium_polylepis.1
MAAVAVASSLLCALCSPSGQMVRVPPSPRSSALQQLAAVPTSPLVVALDVDGVLLDSEPELTRVAWRTSCQLWPEVTDACAVTEHLMDDTRPALRHWRGWHADLARSEDEAAAANRAQRIGRSAARAALHGGGTQRKSEEAATHCCHSLLARSRATGTRSSRKCLRRAIS